MKKTIITFILIVFIIFSFIGCESKESNENSKINIAVSIAPQKTFVEAVGGNNVLVSTLIPPGASPANYQPSPLEMKIFEDAKIYFSIGVPAEESNILTRIENFNKEIRLVPLHDEVDKVYTLRYFSKQTLDPHSWLSPKRVIVMIEAIRDELISIDPDNKDNYIDNAKAYIKELNQKDKELLNAFSQLENKKFIITHPALGYFADDYGLEMIALEEDGKHTHPSKLEEVISIAKKNNIKVVFYQAEFSNEQAKILAKEIDGSVVEIKTLSSDYLNNLTSIKNAFIKEYN